jgi:hypothetical protein
MTHRIDPAMQSVQMATTQSRLHRIVTHSHPAQLSDRDHSMLPCRQRSGL